MWEWIYIIGFNALLLISSIIWYEVPGAMKLARKLAMKGEKIKDREIETLINKMGLKNIEIYCIESKSANAFQVGGRGKYIFISNRLGEVLDKDEILAVTAHELAHIKLKHVLKKMLLFDAIIGIGINMAFILPFLDSTRMIDPFLLQL